MTKQVVDDAGLADKLAGLSAWQQDLRSKAMARKAKMRKPSLGRKPRELNLGDSDHDRVWVRAIFYPTEGGHVLVGTQDTGLAHPTVFLTAAKARRFATRINEFADWLDQQGATP